MNKYNLLTRSVRINLDDVSTVGRDVLESAVIELNLTLRAVGHRLKTYGDNYIDDLDTACGNTEAKEIFDAVDTFLRPYRDVGSLRRAEAQNDLTALLWRLRNTWTQKG